MNIECDARKYSELASAIKQKFQDTYVDDDGRITGDTQTGYALAIVFDLLNPKQLESAANHLVSNLRDRNWRPSTGFIGTKLLMLALAKIGRNDIAYRVLHNDSFPSWNFSIKNGATTIWERWDGWTPEKGYFDPNMNSFNHYAFGAIYQWMVENIGGIRPLKPGYREFEIAPDPGDLQWASVSYDSPSGKIRSEWSIKDSVMSLNISVPPNTVAYLQLPKGTNNPVLVDLDNTVKSISFSTRKGKLSALLISGSYKINVSCILDSRPVVMPVKPRESCNQPV